MDDGRSLSYFGNDRTAAHIVSLLYDHMRVPKLFRVQSAHADSSVDIRSRIFGKHSQRTLDTVKNIRYDPRRQRNGQRCARSHDFFSRLQSRGFLKYLYCRHIRRQGNYFAYQLFLPHIDHFRHFKSGISLEVNNRTVDSIYISLLLHRKTLALY